MEMSIREKFFSEESLKRPLADLFDLVCKIGKGSYGNVYKAIHKESSQAFAVKQIPVESDLQEIIKEISIMHQCDSPFIVKYFGSFFQDSDLWIVMEYCEAGSVSDIMKLLATTLSEEQIAPILSDTLKGLEYLHLKKKIHRDIKAGNILLNVRGNAKLADFGVAGQLSDTMSKRNTVIGTPFWMAPEIIQEIGYDCSADIWSLGVTSIEMADGKPPYAEIHPIRAIFMIPTKPPPSFREPKKFSASFIDFVTRCLVKNPAQRASASELLQHEFIRNARPSTILCHLIDDAIRERNNILANLKEDEELNSMNESQSLTSSDLECRTLIERTDVVDRPGKVLYKNEEAFQTIKSVENRKKKKTEMEETEGSLELVDVDSPMATMVLNEDASVRLSKRDEKSWSSLTTEIYPKNNESSGEDADQIRASIQKEVKLFEREKNVILNLTVSEIQLRLDSVDSEMQREIESLKSRYEKKRELVLKAIEIKKSNHQMF